MTVVREIRRRVKGARAVDGAGVRLLRVFGAADVRDFDPFLLLDAFDSTDPEDYVRGFPWHPHRGIETVTYLVSGRIEHGDSLGNSGAIDDCSCQWMTAGSGIIHQEMPRPAPRMLGFQLWLNLPRASKMVPPAYRDLRGKAIPELAEAGARVRIIAGGHGGLQGEFQGDYVAASFLDVELAPGRAWERGTAAGATVFAYLMEGSGSFGSSGEEGSGQALLFEAGEVLRCRAGDRGLRFVLLEGMPLHEPVAWGGPIVMNTQEELALAFEELERGTFIKDR